MFPNGWPGRGLLLLRVVAGILLINDGALDLLRPHQWEGTLSQSIAILAGTLLLVGFWTPLAGALVVIVELWAALSRAHSLRSSVVLATLGAALAMLGPGVRSVDARLFGRKRIDIR
jgi:uncharacterized membrane protein YphA (DoxX/SURF4 family)